MFQISSDCHLKHADLLNGGPFKKFLVTVFKESKVFLLTLK